MKIADYRREYTQSGLYRADLDTNPFQQFDRWFTQAIKSDYPDANAMTLATVSATGKPTQRTVLLKGYDSKGFVFFTNYDSGKGHDIAENDQVSLLFSWLQVERQIEISGTAVKLSSADSAEYFHSRPESSQLGAWASHQSQSIESREDLLKQLNEVTERFSGDTIPLPEHWGGYLVVPNTVEFWQGREGRLHDRFEYTLSDKEWHMKRLQP
ncbi:pyridoxamine 5'-phosphate oxidase [Leucothrix arctica]|uniref:Pyridoxine/pyridoxamine 5'-phosphate oxidase n=1 Tax=Leucothrix arctica TaxID=1481894 RepID=A0A317CK99_9GAMM|nr:pyridoxamine 5'-phosphate oxidase [Leucothrix arctica]PWQ98759.1 pyridoxamine 5'-phosphate oxidase [Leucothrix arctica]